MLQLTADLRVDVRLRQPPRRGEAAEEESEGVDAGGGDEEVWINLTTGTWPSPFFLLWADSIWRTGLDVETETSPILSGLTTRQKWQIYRECTVHEQIVR